MLRPETILWLDRKWKILVLHSLLAKSKLQQKIVILCFLLVHMVRSNLSVSTFEFPASFFVRPTLACLDCSSASVWWSCFSHVSILDCFEIIWLAYCMTWDDDICFYFFLLLLAPRSSLPTYPRACGVKWWRRLVSIPCELVMMWAWPSTSIICSPFAASRMKKQVCISTPLLCTASIASSSR